MVLERFTRSSDTHLKYSEFSEAFMPLDQHFARLLGTKKLSYMSRPGRSPFEIGTLDRYIQVWEVMIENEKAAEGIRQRLYKRPRFNIDDAFCSCDISMDGFLTASEVLKMWNNYI